MIILYHVAFGIGFSMTPWIYSAEVCSLFAPSTHFLIVLTHSVAGQLSWMENPRRCSSDICKLDRRVCGGADHQGGLG